MNIVSEPIDRADNIAYQLFVYIHPEALTPLHVLRCLNHKILHHYGSNAEPHQIS